MNLCAQLEEIELLQSIFDQDLSITDPVSLVDAKLVLSGKEPPTFMTRELCFSIKFDADHPPPNDFADHQWRLELFCSFPSSYPQSVPSFSLRTSLRKDSQSRLMASLKEHCLQLQGEPCIYAAVSWLKENFGKEALVSFETNASLVSTSGSIDDQKKVLSFAQEFIYFHHIYNKEKRRHIQEWSAEFDLTGFCSSGKPGLVYVEGEESNVQAYVSRLRKLPWQKIQTKIQLKRKVDPSEDIACLRIFKNFTEMQFASANSNTHVNMSALKDFMVANSLGDKFPLVFGLKEEDPTLEDDDPDD